MKISLLVAPFILAICPVAAVAATDARGTAPKAADKSAPVASHPLRGVIVNLVPDKSAMMVKHEEIPGVMRAMTMMFHVDAATLKAFKPGDAITAKMSRLGTIWKLEDVKPAAPKPAK